MNMKNINFQYYIGGIKRSVASGDIDLIRFVDRISKPKDSTLKLLEDIAEASRVGDKVLKNNLKENLPFFTPAVRIKSGCNRRYSNIESFTGLAQLDFDGFENVDISIDCRDWLFNNNSEVVCAYLSPSGRGVKALVRITKVSCVDGFQGIYRALKKKYEVDYNIKQFDSAPLNAVLPLFYSYDPNVLYRDNATVFSDVVEKEVYVANEFVMIGEYEDRRVQGLVKAFFNRIGNIVDNGHYQFRNASLMLGSLSPHYVSRNDALEYISNAIRGNQYLSTAHPFETYYKTGVWALNKGGENPFYLD